MPKKNTNQENEESIEEFNNAFLEILDELVNTISMEKKYCTAGIEMNNNKALVKLRERLQSQNQE